MNSKEDKSLPSQLNGETRVDGPDNANRLDSSKIQNKFPRSDQLKLNNNLGEELEKPEASTTRNGSSQAGAESLNSNSNPAPYILLFPKSGTSGDSDMINNVDYGTGVDKCPAKVTPGDQESSGSTNPVWTSSNFVPRGLNNIGNSIGSTSQGTCCFLRPNINGSREAAGPSGTQRVNNQSLPFLSDV